MHNAGRTARTGFYYQDLCALRYLVGACRLGDWDELWCESLEDVALVRLSETGPTAIRIVQVKWQRAASQHWTCALICSPTPRGSILGKLLFREVDGVHCEFRLAVNEGTDIALKPFHYYYGQVEPTVDVSCAGALDLVDKLSGVPPPRDVGWPDYIARFAIEQHSTQPEELEEMVRSELRAWLHTLGLDLLHDEIEEVCLKASAMVSSAARADTRAPGESNKIQVRIFHANALMTATRAQDNRDAAAANPLGALRDELLRCGVYSSDVEEAAELRRRFEAELRSSLETPRAKLLEALQAEVRAVCLSAKARALSNDPSNGNALARLFEDLQNHDWRAFGLEKTASLANLQGAVYFLMSRGWRLTNG